MQYTRVIAPGLRGAGVCLTAYICKQAVVRFVDCQPLVVEVPQFVYICWDRSMIPYSGPLVGCASIFVQLCTPSSGSRYILEL